MPMKNNELYNNLSLDAIVETILDKMHEHTPSFLMETEKNTEREIEEYTKRITRQFLPKNNLDVIPMVESNAGGLVDSICGANRAHFETGMKVGAVLLMQLLGL